LSVVVGRTNEEAQRKYEDYLSYQSKEATLHNYASVTGIDLTKFDPNTPFEGMHTEMGQTHVDRYTKHSTSKKTVQDVIDDFLEKGFRGLTVVGTPEEVADKMQFWVEEADLDGFNLEPYILPSSYTDFVDLVVPELQKRKMFKEDYEEGTFRERLFGKNQARLPEHHPAASFRKKGKLV